jgi:hypothetical protein
MNVSLDGARSKSRLEWDVLERRNERAQLWTQRVFIAVIVVFASYLAWGYFAR